MSAFDNFKLELEQQPNKGDINVLYYISNITVITDPVDDSIYISPMYLINDNNTKYGVYSFQGFAYDSSGALIGTSTDFRNSRGANYDSQASIDLDTFTNPTTHNSIKKSDIANIIVRVIGGDSTNNVNNRITMAYAIFNPNGVSYPYTPRHRSTACFVRGAPILTPSGYRPVESIRTGDLVLTAEKRAVPVKVFQTTIPTTTTATAPYHIPAGTLGQPNDMYLSPMHAIQVAKGLWHIPEFLAKFVPAVQQYDIGKPVTYYHIECPKYLRDNLDYNGATVESFGNKQVSKRVYTWNPEKMAFNRLNILSAPSKGLS